MANISIKDVPDVWAEALRQRAARNHRSLQGEMMSIIEQAMQAAGDDRAGNRVGAGPIGNPLGNSMQRVAGYEAGGRPVMRRSRKSVEQVAAELKARFPEPVTDAPLGVDIIRAERDAQ